MPRSSELQSLQGLGKKETPNPCEAEALLLSPPSLCREGGIRKVKGPQVRVITVHCDGGTEAPGDSGKVVFELPLVAQEQAHTVRVGGGINMEGAENNSPITEDYLFQHLNQPSTLKTLCVQGTGVDVMELGSRTIALCNQGASCRESDFNAKRWRSCVVPEIGSRILGMNTRGQGKRGETAGLGICR